MKTSDLPTAILIINCSKVYPLNKPTISIGRSADNDIIIDDPHVSRYHAKLSYKNGHFEIVDLGSTSGTYLNGKQIKKRGLSPGDIISLAYQHLIFGQEDFPNVEKVTQYKHPSRLQSNQGDTKDLKQRRLLA
jgi:pSer/pThr/pTyr-binding forkhead associated (FHA) protein